ncbi:probable LRR receptor-like serine/threonine-protein kinase At1g56140 isoform X1 [Argentina anserina]|uniref:probable LRR receptor-like serine/threonine-protein kinase At1g56140 isoform X1 n=2 Tax=Argentina anserina TaxID=57926 RepID=UPI00217650B0|nr:probable LRR receptor-like serine/threonine-protein kinase At1g56140 isoform X1 [Potentilla anserina]XP_050372624.1 probable LRR receptor-like serine/threonine-protein kinase At1g56140 isoform X1 [Potentilla anserina]
MARRLLEVMSPAEPSPSKPRSPALFFFLGGIILLIVLLIIVFIFRKKIKPQEIKKLLARARKQPASTDAFSGVLRTISYFDFPTLKKATKNFHQNNLLGRGGFGPVYRGKLKDGRSIAVKRLSLDKSQQGETEFLAEVRLITSVQHRNLVQLVGCCSHGPQRLLVYEYMKNKSLDHIIYGKSDLFLNWRTRFQIILGIARGLQYLHEDSPLRIIHRDIKASNILLDEKFQPRIGDFGLARFFPEDQAYLSTTFAGTLGYTAPEYAIRGELSEKADIYSFGVLVLEIISGRKNTDLNLESEMQYLPEYAWKLYERSKVTDLLDPKLQDDGFEAKDIMQAINVAFLCLQPHANLRPPMSDIVAMLTCKVQITGILPMKPAFLERRRTKDENLSWDTMSDVFPSPVPSESPSLHKEHA